MTKPLKAISIIPYNISKGPRLHVSYTESYNFFTQLQELYRILFPIPLKNRSVTKDQKLGPKAQIFASSKF